MIPFWVVVLVVVRIVCTKRAIKRQNWLMTTMNKILQQELQYRTGTDLKQVSIIYILGLLPHYIIFIYLHDPKSNAETEKGLSAIPDLPML